MRGSSRQNRTFIIFRAFAVTPSPVTLVGGGRGLARVTTIRTIHTLRIAKRLCPVVVVLAVVPKPLL